MPKTNANTAPETSSTPAPAAVVIDSRKLADILAGIDTDARQAAADKVVKSFDDRDAFEQGKPHYDSIKKALAKSRSKLGTAAAAAILVATNVDAGFVNRQITAGKGFNVYAIDKLADVVATLNGAPMKNAINRAIILSLFSFKKAGEPFTGEMAKAAASDKVRVEGKLRKLLTSHVVSASTAPTQASSTMSALTTLGIVANKGTPKAPVYELQDTPATRRLEEVLFAKAA